MPAIKCRKEGRKNQLIRKQVLLTWALKHNVQILPQAVLETERYSVLSSYYNVRSRSLQIVHYIAEHIFLMLLSSSLLRIYKLLAKSSQNGNVGDLALPCQFSLFVIRIELLFFLYLFYLASGSVECTSIRATFVLNGALKMLPNAIIMTRI